MAGTALLPLVEAALLDTDRSVRQYALGVLERVAHEANRARLTSRRVVTDPSLYPPLYQTLLRLMSDPDTAFRGGVIAALAALDEPPGATSTRVYVPPG